MRLDPRSWRLLDRWAALLPPNPGADRTDFYRQRDARQAFIAEEAATGEEQRTALFGQLGLTLDIREAAVDDLARVADLINRTNQFNMAGSRTTKRRIEELAADPAARILIADAADRFGTMGTISVLIVQRAAGRLAIDDFVLSCRVFGYGMEFAILEEARRLAGDEESLFGAFRETDHNQPCRAVYGEAGFVPAEGGWRWSAPDRARSRRATGSRQSPPSGRSRAIRRCRERPALDRVEPRGAGDDDGRGDDLDGDPRAAADPCRLRRLRLRHHDLRRRPVAAPDGDGQLHPARAAPDQRQDRDDLRRRLASGADRLRDRAGGVADRGAVRPIGDGGLGHVRGRDRPVPVGARDGGRCAVAAQRQLFDHRHVAGRQGIGPDDRLDRDAALAALGAYALVAGLLANGLTSFVASLASLTWRQRLRPRRDPEHWRVLRGFGGRSLLLTIAQVGAIRVPDLLVGRLLSLPILGHYGRATNAIDLVIRTISASVVRATQPRLYRRVNEGQGLPDAIAEFADVLLFFVWPAVAGVAVLSAPLIRLIYGPQWDIAAQALPILCLVVAIEAARTGGMETFLIHDRLGANARLEFVRSAYAIVMVIVAARWGLVAVLWARVLESVVTLVVYLVAMARFRALAKHHLWRVFGVNALLAAAAAGPAFVMMRAWGWPGALGVAEYGLTIGAGGLCWLAALVALRHPFMRRGREIARARFAV